ncbi:MAG: hypothetical protein ACYCRG_05825 [Acidimicrobiales bacterium]
MQSRNGLEALEDATDPVHLERGPWRGPEVGGEPAQPVSPRHDLAMDAATVAPGSTGTGERASGG